MSHPQDYDHDHHQLEHQIAQQQVRDSRAQFSLIPSSIIIMFGLLTCETLIGIVLVNRYGTGHTPAAIGWYESVSGMWLVGLPSLVAAWWGIERIRKDSLKTLIVVFGNMAVHFGTLVVGCFGLILVTGFDATTVLLSGLFAFAICLVVSTAAFRTALLAAPRPAAREGRRSGTDDHGKRSGVETLSAGGDNGPDQRFSSDHFIVSTEVTS